jgi:hypothetical protein
LKVAGSAVTVSDDGGRVGGAGDDGWYMVERVGDDEEDEGIRVLPITLWGFYFFFYNLVPMHVSDCTQKANSQLVVDILFCPKGEK